MANVNLNWLKQGNYYITAITRRSPTVQTCHVWRKGKKLEGFEVMYDSSTADNTWRVTITIPGEHLVMVILFDCGVQVHTVSIGNTLYKAPRYLKHWQEALEPVIKYISTLL